MNEKELELLLSKSMDELYADLVELDEDNPMRSSNYSMQALVQAGRLKFEEYKESIQTAICTSEVFDKITVDTNEKTLITIVADGLIAAYGKTAMPVASIAALSVKIGLTRLCRNRL